MTACQCKIFFPDTHVCHTANNCTCNRCMYACMYMLACSSMLRQWQVRQSDACCNSQILGIQLTKWFTYESNRDIASSKGISETFRPQGSLSVKKQFYDWQRPSKSNRLTVITPLATWLLKNIPVWFKAVAWASTTSWFTSIVLLLSVVCIKVVSSTLIQCVCMPSLSYMGSKCSLKCECNLWHAQFYICPLKAITSHGTASPVYSINHITILHTPCTSKPTWKSARGWNQCRATHKEE